MKADLEPWEYTDTGCHLHPACLSCPRPICLYDTPPTTRRTKANEPRNQAVIQAAQASTITELTRNYGISRRTAYRILAQAERRPNE